MEHSIESVDYRRKVPEHSAASLGTRDRAAEAPVMPSHHSGLAHRLRSAPQGHPSLCFSLPLLARNHEISTRPVLNLTYGLKLGAY